MLKLSPGRPYNTYKIQVDFAAVDRRPPAAPRTPVMVEDVGKSRP